MVSLYEFERPSDQFMQGNGCYVGDALVGDEVAGRFSIPGDELTNNSVLLAGQTGMGKTYAICNLILRLREQDPGRTVVVYDSENEFGGMLANFLGPEELIVIDYRDYWKNMFMHMRVYGSEWIDRLSSDFFLNIYIGDSGKLLFTENAMRLNTRKSVISRGGYAPYGELANHIAGLPASGKMHQYKMTLLSRLKGLGSSLGPIYNHRWGFTWDDFSGAGNGKVVVINLFGMDALARALFISIELSELYFYSTARNFKATVCFDEFHRYSSAGRKKDEYVTSSVNEIAKVGRKRGLRLLCAEQNVSLVEPEVLGNIGAFFAFRTRDPKDRMITARFMNLVDQEQSEALSNLQRQKCVFVCGCLDAPVPLRIPDLNVRDLSAEALERSRPFVEACHEKFRGERWGGRSAGEVDEEPERDDVLAGDVPDRRRDDAHLRCLRAVRLNPFFMQKDYFGLWGLSGGSALKMKNELCDLEFLEEYRVNPGGKGGAFKSLWVTEKGFAFTGLEAKKPRGKGGREHVCLQHLVARRLRSMGAEAIVEGDVSGKNVDVKVYINGRVEAWEIELDVTPQTMKNILDDLERRADMVKVLVRSKGDWERVHDMVGEYEEETRRALLGSRVSIGYVGDYI